MNIIKKEELKLCLKVSRELLRNNKDTYLEIKKVLEKEINKLK